MNSGLGGGEGGGATTGTAFLAFTGEAFFTFRQCWGSKNQCFGFGLADSGFNWVSGSGFELGIQIRIKAVQNWPLKKGKYEEISWWTSFVGVQNRHTWRIKKNSIKIFYTNLVIRSIGLDSDPDWIRIQQQAESVFSNRLDPDPKHYGTRNDLLRMRPYC